jgi:peroxiredoxin
MTAEFSKLPVDLPRPADDGAARHLHGLKVPEVSLPASDGSVVGLSTQPSRVVLYVFPMMGQPGVPLPNGWDAFPGARGCTVQSLTYSKSLGDLSALGLTVFGLSGQSVDELNEAKGRLGLKQELLSDQVGDAREALGLPTFEIEGKTYLRRLTLGISDGTIECVLYPVFPPGSDVDAIREWAGQ